MNLLIVSKDYEQGEYWEDWKKMFEERGHTVDAGSKIKNIVEKSSSLGKYEVALAHPSHEDAKMLYNEVKKRKDFRVILALGDSIGFNKQEGIEGMIHSNQVCYFYLIGNDQLIRLVEKGW